MMLRYRSYAKINLYLDVLPARMDGYHDIETIFQSVGLHDILEFTPQEKQITLECSRDDLGDTKQNLAYRAAELLRETSGTTDGVHIKLEKRIPVAAGLAGGSSNAAAALVACNKLWGLGYTPEYLCKLAAKLGADIPFCIRGGTMAATGIGDRLHPLPPTPQMWAVLLHPDIAISTPWVYKHPDLQKNAEHPYLDTSDTLVNFPATSTFRTALQDYARGDWKALVFNRMEAPVFAAHPQLAEHKQRLLHAGCTAAAMSGSGSTVFGLCETEEAARGVADKFNDLRVSCAEFVRQGVEEYT